jgi:hypothetical protein
VLRSYCFGGNDMTVTREDVLAWIDAHKWTFGDVNNPLDTLTDQGHWDGLDTTAHFYNVPGLGLIQYDSSNGQIFVTDNPFGMAHVGQLTTTELQGQDLTPTTIQTQQGGLQDQIGQLTPYIGAAGLIFATGGAAGWWDAGGTLAEVGSSAAADVFGSSIPLVDSTALAVVNPAYIQAIDFGATLSAAEVGGAAAGAGVFSSSIPLVDSAALSVVDPALIQTVDFSATLDAATVSSAATAGADAYANETAKLLQQQALAQSGVDLLPTSASIPFIDTTAASWLSTLAPGSLSTSEIISALKTASGVATLVRGTGSQGGGTMLPPITARPSTAPWLTPAAPGSIQTAPAVPMTAAVIGAALLGLFLMGSGKK